MRSQSFAFLAAGSGMQSNSQGTRQVKKNVEAGVGQKDIMIVVRPVIMVWRWFCYNKVKRRGEDACVFTGSDQDRITNE